MEGLDSRGVLLSYMRYEIQVAYYTRTVRTAPSVHDGAARMYRTALVRARASSVSPSCNSHMPTSTGFHSWSRCVWELGGEPTREPTSGNR